MSPYKTLPIRNDGGVNRNYTPCPLARVAGERLKTLREERLTFVIVGDPLKCTEGCWQRRQEQQAQRRAHETYGDSVQGAQFPLAQLRTAEELSDTFRGYALRCPCLGGDE